MAHYYSIATYHSTCISAVSLINESLPGTYLKARQMNHSAFIAIFMWLVVGSLISHAYRFRIKINFIVLLLCHINPLLLF